MPWHKDADWAPSTSLLHFGLHLNLVLSSMRRENIILNYAFADTMALFLLANSAGRPDITPSPTELSESSTARFRLGETPVRVFPCHLYLEKNPFHDVFSPFVAALNNIGPSDSRMAGRWSHTHRIEIIGGVEIALPEMSTYEYQRDSFSSRHVFRILWQTYDYPPQGSIEEYVYHANPQFLNIHTHIPILAGRLLASTQAEQIKARAEQQATSSDGRLEFLLNFLNSNTSKGKGKETA